MGAMDVLFRLIFGRRGPSRPAPTPRTQTAPPPAPQPPAPPPITPAPAPRADSLEEANAEPLAPVNPTAPNITFEAAPTPEAPPEPPLSAYRIAKALDRLRAQVNAKYPDRAKVSDGWIGDAAHASRDSDHNPWIIDGDKRVVSALDITNDVEKCSARVLVDALVASRDPRIKYIIFERQMVSSYPTSSVPAWTWRPYRGQNAHNHHCHISVIEHKNGYDDERDWAI